MNLIILFLAFHMVVLVVEDRKTDIQGLIPMWDLQEELQLCGVELQ